MFDAVYDSEGSVQMVMLYACLGRLLPFTKRLFSFQLFSRTPDIPEVQLRALVDRIDNQTHHLLDIGNVRIAGQETYARCGNFSIETNK